MLHYFIRQSTRALHIVPKPRVVIGIPSGVTEVERRAVHDAELRPALAKRNLIEEQWRPPLELAYHNQPAGCMIVDIAVVRPT